MTGKRVETSGNNWLTSIETTNKTTGKRVGKTLNELNRVEMTDKREETTSKRVKPTSRGVETSTNDL